MSDFLCEELIDEIFTRLPPKSLLRFRSLSKFLCSYIGSPHFIRKHILRSPQKLLIRHRTYYNDFVNDEDFCTLHAEDQLPLFPKCRYIGGSAIPFPSRKNFYIVGSYNGILCLSDYVDIILWNPSIRRKVTLPDCPRRCFNAVEIAFGFDPVTDDYKIVCIPGYVRGYVKENVESSFVYALKTRAWCVIASPTSLFTSVASNAYFVNGTLHWVVERDNVAPTDINRSYILTFDLSSHVFGMIVLPTLAKKSRQQTTIQGSLAAISMSYSDIWIWVKRGASWYFLFKWEINKVEGGLDRVLQSTSNGDLFFKTFSGETHVYHHTIGAQSRLANLNSASDICDMEMCVESLELLDMGTTCEVN